MHFSLESQLVDEFINKLPSSVFADSDHLDISTEFNYQRGRTDVLILNREQEIIAFEAKLEKWRDALDQAYRNTCYAHYSYIVVPQDTATRASRYSGEFSDRAVGICTISDGKIILVKEATRSEPIQEWLSEKAVDYIKEGKDANQRIRSRTRGKGNM